jgi:hypothetical protein
LEREYFEQVGAVLAQPYSPESPGEQLVLEFFTGSEEIHAGIFCPQNLRVSDVLNRVDDAGSWRNAFIEMVESGIEAYITRDTIEFVAAEDPDAGRGVGRNSEMRGYPFVEKTPIPVNVQTASYRIIGKAYHMKNKNLKATLSENSIFLPLTDALIMRGSRLIGRRPFVAINKKQILSIKKDLIT